MIYLNIILTLCICFAASLVGAVWGYSSVPNARELLLERKRLKDRVKHQKSLLDIFADTAENYLLNSSDDNRYTLQILIEEYRKGK